jgi:hypothetical protein
VEKARNFKILLYLYEQMSGLKINFEKSEVMLVGGDDNIVIGYADLFNCQTGLFPMKYLGVPISASRLHVVDWTKMEEKPPKKLETWCSHENLIAYVELCINLSRKVSTDAFPFKATKGS